MAPSLKSLALGLVATLTVSAPAFATWTEILSLHAPQNGTFRTTHALSTDRIRVVKRGPDCSWNRMAFTPIGRDIYTTIPLILETIFVRENEFGDSIYAVVPRAAMVFDLYTQAIAGGPHNRCTYTFYALTD